MEIAKIGLHCIFKEDQSCDSNRKSSKIQYYHKWKVSFKKTMKQTLFWWKNIEEISLFICFLLIMTFYFSISPWYFAMIYNYDQRLIKRRYHFMPTHVTFIWVILNVTKPKEQISKQVKTKLFHLVFYPVSSYLAYIISFSASLLLEL